MERHRRRLFWSTFWAGVGDGILYFTCGIMILFGILCIVAFFVQFPFILILAAPAAVVGLIVGLWRVYSEWRYWR